MCLFQRAFKYKEVQPVHTDAGYFIKWFNAQNHIKIKHSQTHADYAFVDSNMLTENV